MDSAKDVFLRKIQTRMKAIENMGQEKKVVENQDDVYFELCNNLSKANENWQVYPNNETRSTRSIIGSIVVLLKKFVRKMISWYIMPMSYQQTMFNSYIVNTLNMVKEKIDYYHQYDEIINDNYKTKEAIVKLELQLAQMRSEIIQTKLQMAEIETQFKQVQPQLVQLEQQLMPLEMQLAQIENKLNYLLNQNNVNCDLNLLKTPSIDYFKFEDRFRGSRERIMNSQSEYLKYYQANEPGIVLDLGCGRGEFLELMWKNSIKAKGVDSYPPFVEYCKNRGFDIELEDILTYLSKVDDNSLNGIFMAHVIEHISLDYKLALIKMAYKKLKIGKYFILETPNPQSLLTYVDFYVDPTHINPVHYKTLEFFFEEAGYSEVRRFDNPNSRFKDIVTGISGEGINNIDDFNYGMGNLNEWLSKYQDYTLIAKK